MIERRSDFLVEYQNEAYAARYRALVGYARSVENRLSSGETYLTEAVARSFFRLMAYKDEYEVARLHTDRSFHDRIASAFEGRPRLAFNLAPPFLGQIDPSTGRPAKREFGAWILPIFSALARLRVLRGSVFDPFG